MNLRKKFVAFALAFALALPATDGMRLARAADVRVCINEVCSQNKSCLADSYGSYSDWIELYNSGTTPVELSGYGLSDKSDMPLQWTFPAQTVLAPNSYLVVFASQQASTGSELHTGFALSKNGEALVLSLPDGTLLQSVTIPTLGEDRTYGRTPDGGEPFEIMDATPGRANSIVTSAPEFSAASGFYGAQFSLRLSARNNAEIYYTMDGSDPTRSNTAQRYFSELTVNDRTNQPNLYSNYEENDSNVSVSRGTGYKKPTFSVDKATVVRAAAKGANGIFSTVVSQTYFVTSGALSDYKNMTVVSLVTNPDNLFDPDNGIYVTGNQYINWRNSSAYNPNKSVWDTDNISNFFSKGKAWEREASVTIFENGTTAVQQNMGIRIKGASTRNAAQKSFNLYARSDYGASKIERALLPDNLAEDGTLIDAYDTICLRSVGDEVRLRDGFAQGLLADREDLTTQAMKPCVMFLNGEYWGLYMMTEQISDAFIASHFGIKKGDVAILKNAELEEGPQAELDAFNAFAESYSKKDLTNAQNYQAVSAYIDLDSMIDHYAAGLYLGTYDWPNRNAAVWRSMGEPIADNPYSDGRWRFITFDLDYSMGATYADFGGVEGYAYDSFRHMDGGKLDVPTNLFVALLKSSTFRAKFVAVYCDYANEVLTAQKGNARADVYSRQYTNLLADTTLRWWGFFGGTPSSLLPYYQQEYQNKTLPGIRTFFEQRAGYTLEDMKQYLQLGGSLQTLTLRTDGNGSIRLNSITPNTTNGAWSGKYYSDSPVTLTAVPANGYAFTGWGGDVNAADSKETTITVTLRQAMSIQAQFVERQTVQGDVNADGRCDAADATALQQWLLAQSNVRLADWQAGDMDGDGKLTAVDLCLLKRILVA